MKLPSKDSALGRSLRVLAYQVVVLVLGWLADPNVVKGIVQFYPQLTTVFVLGAPILSGLYNYVRQDVPNL